jgi:hypothetical protein
MNQKRVLSHDEKKASEAAFRGLPFNPKWSNSARMVYEGIAQVLGNSKKEDPEPFLNMIPATEFSQAEEQVEAEDPVEDQGISSPNIVESESTLTFSIPADSLPLNSRKKSITAGTVKDATPAAKRIGLEIPVGLTNALWKNYVAISHDMTEEHIQSRLQDIMVGVRLRLANLKEALPFVDVPLLLHFPPEAVPQVNLAFALFHRDPEEGPCLLLIHPGEILPPRQNISQN